MSNLSAFNDSHKVIGERIREKRTQWGMSQEELAAAVDVTLNYIGEIERGRRSLSLSVAEQLCLIFGVTYDYFYLGIERPADRIAEATPASDLSAKSALLDLVCASNEEDCQDYLNLIKDLRRAIQRKTGAL